MKSEYECLVRFQVGRAITNILESSKFALNFYLYCMINPDIRKLAGYKLRCEMLCTFVHLFDIDNGNITLRCTHMGSVRVPMEHSRTDIRSLTRLLQAADQLSMRHSTQVSCSFRYTALITLKERRVRFIFFSSGVVDV